MIASMSENSFNEDDPTNDELDIVPTAMTQKDNSLFKYFQSTKSNPVNVPCTTDQQGIDDNKRVIYNYLKKISINESECNKCKKKLKTPSSITTTMTRHLSSQHSVLFKDYQEKLKIKQKNDNATSTKRKNEGHVQQLSIQNSMSKCTKFPINSKKAKIITDKLVEMIAVDYQPFSIVEDRGFKNFVAELDNRYTLPSRKTLSHILVTEMYESIKMQLKTEIQTDMINAKSVSFTPLENKRSLQTEVPAIPKK